MSSPVVRGAPNSTGTPRVWIVVGCGLLVALLAAPAGALGSGTRANVGASVPVPTATTPGPPLPAAIRSPPVAPAFQPVLGNWTQVPTNSTPPTAQSGDMIYDPAAGEYVLFGGASGGSALGSTWVFSHGTWTDLSPSLSVSPPARWYESFVWDAADGYALLFGGRNPATDFNDTWSFNGTAWTQIVTSVAPPPITTGRTVYDPADGYVWLYGGYSIMVGAPNQYNFTWTYHAGVWTNITAHVTGAPPDPHEVSYAVYDSEDGYVLMYGGSASGGANCTQPGNTWTYLNGTYVNLSASVGTSPPVGAGSRMMADDPAIGGVLLYGGWDGGSCRLSNETWVYRGDAWSQESLPWNPGPLWDGEIAGGGPAGSVLLFSGNTVEGTSYQSNQTWNFTPAVRASIAGGLIGDTPLTVHLSAVVAGV
ncbi:MAG TPA: hypothetical protein VGP88_02535, partial [Thermoplasmata archaeon]|nr:hypothetical protein [Thermoplasmata archaeon]